MKIVHDQERYDDVVAKLRLIYDSIDELSGTMGDISEKLYSFKMEGASSVVEDAIDELEEKLGSEFLEQLSDLITGMENANSSMLELDMNMNNDLRR